MKKEVEQFFSQVVIQDVYFVKMKVSQVKILENVFPSNVQLKFLELEKQGAININLVTPTPHVIGIIKALKIAKKKGLHIPIIYNTSGYENVETLKLLDGLIDVYLPDFKYYDNAYAKKYSKCKDYVEKVKLAIDEMYRQVGIPKFSTEGNIQKGVIVRHLMLPFLKEDTKNI